MIINGQAYYTHIDHFPQKEIKAAVKLLEEASILWDLYDKSEGKGKPHYHLAQSKAAEAGNMICEWSNSQPLFQLVCLEIILMQCVMSYIHMHQKRSPLY